MIVLTTEGRWSFKSDPFRSKYPEETRWGGGGLTSMVGMGLSYTYAQLYKTQPWLAAAVNKISRNIARLPLKTYALKDDGERERVRDHPLTDLLNRPNPKMSAFRLKERLIADVALFGNAALTVVTDPNSKLPVELWPMDWPLVEVQGHRDPETYIYHGPLGPVPIDVDKVLHFRYWSPYSAAGGRFVGASPVEPLRRTLMNEDAAARWSTAMFANGGRPSGIISTDKQLNREQVALVREELASVYGSVDNAFRIAVMQGGLDWKQVSFTAVDSGLIDLRKLNREEVAATYDIPPPMLQILDRATFSNITEQTRMFYSDTLGPWLSFVEDELQTQLIYPNAAWSNVFVEFDLAEVLRGSPKERAETYQIARRYMTVNEIRERENLARLEGPAYDSVWSPVNEFPLSEGPPPRTEPGPLKAVTAALERAEIYGLSRVGSGRNGFDPGRFSKELCADLGRHDDACTVWASHLAKAVETAIHGADSPEALRERMAAVRLSLTLEEAAA